MWGCTTSLTSLVWSIWSVSSSSSSLTTPTVQMMWGSAFVSDTGEDSRYDQFWRRHRSDHQKSSSWSRGRTDGMLYSRPVLTSSSFIFFCRVTLIFFSLSRNRTMGFWIFFTSRKLHQLHELHQSRPLWSEVHEVIDNTFIEFAEVKLCEVRETWQG